MAEENTFTGLEKFVLGTGIIGQLTTFGYQTIPPAHDTDYALMAGTLSFLMGVSACFKSIYRNYKSTKE